MDLSRLKSDSTRDLDSDKSYIRKVRNFLKDNQEMFNHGATSDTAKRPEQTNSRYSKDDSWHPRTAREKELSQLPDELSRLKERLKDNKAELQNLLGNQKEIVAKRNELMNMVKQKEALTLKGELDEFQKALKFPEDGLLDAGPLKKNFEASKKFLQDMKCKGIDTQDLGEFLQSIRSAIDLMEIHITIKNQVERLLDNVKSNIKNNTVDIPSLKKSEIPQIENSEKYSNAAEESSGIYNKLVESSKKRYFSREEVTNMIKETLEKGLYCSQLKYAMIKYTLNLVCQSFENFQKKAKIEIEEQIGKMPEEVRNQPINQLDKDINRTLETIVGPKQGKKQKQATRIEKAKGILIKDHEELEVKIKSIQDENHDLKNKIHHLEDLIGEYARYNPKGSKAAFEKDRDKLAQIYNQEGFEGIKNALSISTKATDARSNH